MKKPDAATSAAGTSGPFPDADWVKRFPMVCEYLSAAAFDDGTPRQLSSLTLREQDGMVLASISDMELSRGLYRTGATVRDALAALEKALETMTADWRPWKQQGRKGGK